MNVFFFILMIYNDQILNLGAMAYLHNKVMNNLNSIHWMYSNLDNLDSRIQRHPYRFYREIVAFLGQLPELVRRSPYGWRSKTTTYREFVTFDIYAIFDAFFLWLLSMQYFCHFR